MQIEASISAMPASRADRSSAAVDIFAKIPIVQSIKQVANFTYQVAATLSILIARPMSGSQGKKRPKIKAFRQNPERTGLPRHSPCPTCNS
jgi:hypothetical protein